MSSVSARYNLIGEYMMKTFFLAPTAASDNLQIACQSVIESLLGKDLSVGFFTPIESDAGEFSVSESVHVTQSISLSDAIKEVCANNTPDLMETVVANFESLKKGASLDVIIVVGVLPSRELVNAAEINARIAQSLNAQTILVASPEGDLAHSFSNRIELSAVPYGGVEHLLGLLLTQTESGVNVSDNFSFLSKLPCQLLGMIPHDVSDSELQGAVDSAYLLEQLSVVLPARVSPPMFRHQLIQRASKAGKRVVLPEGDEPRTVEAAIICHQKQITQCVLIANRSSVEAVVKKLGLTLPDDVEIIEPNDSVISTYVPKMVELRKSRGLTPEDAEKQLQDTVVLGTMMLAVGDVDGLVSGAIHTTANTIRPAFQLIKTRPDAGIASSIFFMLLPENVLIYGDCAINPNPNAEQLATIAIQSAESAREFGIEPKVAMISYSTGVSGAGDDVELVRQATIIAQKKRPDLLIEGPLQYDAASVVSVAKKKAPKSQIAGKANVFIFPDLNTGNTTYKAVQRSAGVVSIGPMLQGLNKPVNDLSRGALVDDIVYTIALTAIQAV